MTWCDLVLTHGMFATMVVSIVAVLDVMILLPTLSAWSDMETLDFVSSLFLLLIDCFLSQNDLHLILSLSTVTCSGLPVVI